MKSLHPTPILKKIGTASDSKRLSVKFFKQEDDEGSTPGSASAATSLSRRSMSSSTSSDMSDGLQQSAYGLYYEPPDPSIPNFSKLTSSMKLATLEESQRPELGNARNDDHVLMLGDVIHGQRLKKELEKSSLCGIRVTLAAVPTAQNTRHCSFIIILLPLEVVGSCHKVSETLRHLMALRTDFLMRCAVVAVTSSHGRDQHVTELLNLHTLLQQHKLSYYVWSDVTPGSWPSILERLTVEIASCRTRPGSSGFATRGCGVSRAVLCSLLWPCDGNSALLQDFLDATVYKTKQDLDI